MDQIGNMKVHEYLEKMAEPSFPSPASGSAAATIAAMAAALLEMSYKVTMKKSEENIRLTLNEIENTRNQCLALATKDMEVLAEIVQSAQFKKESPEKYEHVMRNGTETLVSIMEKSGLILSQIEQLIPICNKRVIAELIGSAYMAESALVSAKFGVEVNLYLLTDEDYKESIQNAIQKSFNNSIKIKERIMKFVEV